MHQGGKKNPSCKIKLCQVCSVRSVFLSGCVKLRSEPLVDTLMLRKIQSPLLEIFAKASESNSSNKRGLLVELVSIKFAWFAQIPNLVNESKLALCLSIRFQYSSTDFAYLDRLVDLCLTELCVYCITFHCHVSTTFKHFSQFDRPRVKSSNILQTTMDPSSQNWCKQEVADVEKGDKIHLLHRIEYT